ncbi:MAG TPA: lipoyl domain-containing protein [Streptosporangiaceae bacterium]|jgi:pyruvate/2-oxoglutarate dehydrogenase complex dihydrolipoamide acyltransferase (E2) component|nr:lipoyl domain-containing protein [Streptosporangiaceae bacterium]
MTSPDPGPGGLVDVVVPKWGMTMDSAVLTEWLKGEGDVVAVDDPLAELETDKAVNELVSQVSGILAELLVEAGAEVEPGQAIARIRPDSLQA